MNTSSTAPSAREVSSWLERVDDITSAIDEILHEDPMKEIVKQEARQVKLKEEEARLQAERLTRIKQRYEPKYFARFSRDEVIDAMLKEVDAADKNEKGNKKRRANGGDEELYTKAESVSLEEAQRLKTEGGKAVQQGNWSEALTLYTNAIKLHVVDEALDTILHNNRSLVHNKLKMYMEAIEDATVVLHREPRNVKALLRRATALRYVHRPVEALQDVTQALRLEPQNQEAVAQRVWLRKAEAELLRGDAFGEQHPEQRQQAEILCAAVQQLLQKDKDLEEGADAKSCLGSCLGILQEGGAGAAILFTVRGGVPPVWHIATNILQQQQQQQSSPSDDDSATLVSSLRIISFVFAQCDIATQEVTADQVSTLVSLLVASAMKTDQKDGTTTTTTRNSILQCLGSLCAPYPSTLHSALSVDGMPLVALWRSDAMRSDATLYYTMELMEKLLKGCAAVEDGCQGDDAKKGSVAHQLLKEPVKGEKGEAASVMVVEAVLRALKVDSPLPLQAGGATIALRLSALASSDADMLKLLTSDLFTSRLRSILERQYATRGGNNSNNSSKDGGESARTMEALYSIIYNTLLVCASREAYVAQWASMSSPFGISTLLDTTDAAAAPVPTPLSSKMWAVVSKCLEHHEKLPPLLVEQVEKVWSWLAVSTEAITRKSATRKTTEGVAVEDSSEEEVLWAHVEHLTTLLATLYTKGYARVASASQAAQSLTVLLTLVESVQLISEESVRAAEELHGIGKGSRTTAPVIALGNGALLYAKIAEQQPTGIAEALIAKKAVDVLLKALRDTRASLHVITREAARPERAAATAVGATLGVWKQHTAAAQKNLAIAISRTCAAGEPLKDRLRELKGFETLVAVQQQQ